MDHSVLVEKSEGVIQPCPTLPLPPEALALASFRQVAPNLLLDPVADIRETPAGVADRKVVHPTPQNGIDLLDQLRPGLRAIAPEIGLSLRSNAVRFLPLGVCSGIHRPRRLRMRRYSKPRNPKLSPC